MFWIMYAGQHHQRCTQIFDRLAKAARGTHVSETGRHIEDVRKVHTRKCLEAEQCASLQGDTGMDVAQMLQDLGLGCRSAFCCIAARDWEMVAQVLRPQPSRTTKGQWQQRPWTWPSQEWKIRNENQGKLRAISYHTSHCSVGLAIPLQQNKHHFNPIFFPVPYREDRLLPPCYFLSSWLEFSVLLFKELIVNSFCCHQIPATKGVWEWYLPDSLQKCQMFNWVLQPRINKPSEPQPLVFNQRS